jgi:hypothetical protein
MIRQARIVKDHHFDGVAVAPKMFVVRLYRFRHVPKTIGGDGEDRCVRFHKKVKESDRPGSVLGGLYVQRQR